MEPAGSDSSKLEGGEREQAEQHAPLRALVMSLVGMLNHAPLSEEVTD